MWSDDDWLKKFSGKTVEEAEAEAAGGETTNTATQEVRWLLLFFFFYLLPTFNCYDSDTSLIFHC